jgi:hypothetical protein
MGFKPKSPQAKLNEVASAFEKASQSKGKSAPKKGKACSSCGQPMPAEKLADLKASDES